MLEKTRDLEWLEPLPRMPEGEVEVIFLYESPSQTTEERPPPSEWPVLRRVGNT